MAYELPQLSYTYSDLEPHIDALTMEIHHSKHHQAYITKLNDALTSAPEWQDKSLEELLQSLEQLPEEIRTKVRNNAGGHWNHTFFWELLSPQGGGEATGELAEVIKKDFGSFAEFQTKFTEAATNHFGSGWAWLVREGEMLKIITTPNQDTPMIQGIGPIIGLDVWEHAYYLKYRNVRPDYIAAWWNVVNWSQAEKNYRQ